MTCISWLIGGKWGHGGWTCANICFTCELAFVRFNVDVPCIEDIISANGCRYAQQFKENEKLSHRYWKEGAWFLHLASTLNNFWTSDFFVMQMELWFLRLWGCAFILRKIFSLVCWNKLQHLLSCEWWLLWNNQHWEGRNWCRNGATPAVFSIPTTNQSWDSLSLGSPLFNIFLICEPTKILKLELIQHVLFKCVLFKLGETWMNHTTTKWY